MKTPADSAGPVIVERTYDAPVEEVWRALTDVEGMRCWYFDLPAFRAEPGFAFRFTVHHEGRDFDHRCRVTEVVPYRLLAYTWRYAGEEGDSLVTFELFPEGGRTRLRVTHEGLESLPPRPEFGRDRFLEGWNSLLGTCLPEYLASRGTGRAEDSPAPSGG